MAGKSTVSTHAPAPRPGQQSAAKAEWEAAWAHYQHGATKTKQVITTPAAAAQSTAPKPSTTDLGVTPEDIAYAQFVTPPGVPMYTPAPPPPGRNEAGALAESYLRKVEQIGRDADATCNPELGWHARNRCRLTVGTLAAGAQGLSYAAATIMGGVAMVEDLARGALDSNHSFSFSKQLVSDTGDNLAAEVTGPIDYFRYWGSNPRGAVNRERADVKALLADPMKPVSQGLAMVGPFAVTPMLRWLREPIAPMPRLRVRLPVLKTTGEAPGLVWPNPLTHTPSTGVGASGTLVCRNPWQWLEIGYDELHVCCPGWMKGGGVIGDVLATPFPEIWNGPQAIAIRQGILDGKIGEYCSGCPFLDAQAGPVMTRAQAAQDPFMSNIINKGVVNTDGPTIVHQANARGCNLQCPSCRTLKISDRRGTPVYDRAIAQIRGVFDGGGLQVAKELSTSGSGEPFVSVVSRDMLGLVDPERYPDLTLRLHTNGVLASAKNIEGLGPLASRVGRVEVSLDAASSEVYAINRVGGNWDQVMNNLRRLGEQRRTGQIADLQVDFVVQANNFDEMIKLVELARQHHVDRVLFTPLRDWPHAGATVFGNQKWLERAVHLPSHPQHEPFLRVLNDPRLQSPDVILGGMTKLRDAAR